MSPARPNIVAVIPAQTGTCTLDLEDGVTFRTPVLAWAIDAQGVAYPITLSPGGIDFEESKSWSSTYQFPDGSVHTRLGQHESFDTWLAFRQKAPI
jgi:hypothetical protein